MSLIVSSTGFIILLHYNNYYTLLYLDLHDCISVCTETYHDIVLILFFSAVIIGFEQTMYTVNESIGELTVYVSVFNPPVDEELFVAESIYLTIQTISINASKYL